MEEISIRINAGAGYNVTIGQDILAYCGDMLRQVAKPCKTAIITDSVVCELYLEAVERSLRAAGFETVSYVFEHGEGSKNLAILSDILEFLAENRLKRSDMVIALGGGVTGDMAGFAAGVYLRGIRYVQMPTTLLAAVDSSVGGKTGVDLKSGKNLAGVFWQPSAVICDTQCLKTLPEEVFSAGAAEAIKYGVIQNEGLFRRFESGDVSNVLTEIVAECVRIKAAIVETDEFDTGGRRLLNLGHTFGHAIENCGGYAIAHGHAVAIGMVMSARAGEKLSITEPGVSAELSRVLVKNGLPVSTEFTADELLRSALNDKKRINGEIALVFPRRIGDCVLWNIPISELGHIIELSAE